VAKPATWDQILRKQVKLEHGRGWSISPQSGRAKLTRRHPDGTRSSVTLSIPWAASSGSAINAAVARLRQLMEERGLGLAEAYGLIGSADSIAAAEGGLSWQRVAEQFLESRADRRRSTLGDLRYRVGNVLKTLETKPKPRDGRSLMRAYAAQYFAKCPPGGKGRRAHLGDVAALLDFAVSRCGAHSCWKPIEGEELRELIGAVHRGAGEELRRPIKPEQLAGLLDALEADGKPELRLAVGLVGLFGLRPAELAVLRVDDGGRLRVGADVKRNRWAMKRPKAERLALALDIPGREGEGDLFLQLYASGLVKLPPRILTTIERGEFKPVGEAFRKLLERYPHWQSLVAANPGLTPYSLRHGYAWRGHKSYDHSLSVRDLSALMGHTPTIHLQHYGKWTDEAGLIEAVQKLSRVKLATDTETGTAPLMSFR
jgi:integrase